MKPDRLPRRLAAIFYADVAGYSRLTGEDEDATHRQLTDSLDLISATVSVNRGRVMHYAGDAVLAMFDAAVDAVSCAVEVQTQLAERNGKLPDGRKVEFRIGINLGDVIEDRGDVYGDGVNVAARLEGLAAPGTVCVSEAIRTAVGKKLPLIYEPLGEQHVKNISEAVRAYQVLSPVDRGSSSKWSPKATTLKRIAFVTIAVAVAVVGGGLYWLATYNNFDAPQSAKLPAFRSDNAPSIAVLPFTNLSEDTEQEFFADGMTDDLITDLSKLSGLFVIARNSVFRYKNEHVSLQEIAKNLHVRYVLEGSVRRAGDTLRINVQLTDTLTAGHIWAERYDGNSADVFALQDNVVGNIVSALKVALSEREKARLARIPTSNIEAYDLYLRGKRRLWVRSAPSKRDALMYFQKAITLDREFAEAYAGVARVASEVWREGAATILPRSLARTLAYQASGKALEFDPQNAEAYSVIAYLQLADGQHDEALRSVETAISLQPNAPQIHADLCNLLVYAGRPQEALKAIETAFSLEPHPPPTFFADQGNALFANQQYRQAAEPLEKALQGGVERLEPLAKTYALLGRLDEAKALIDRLVEINPGASLARYRLDEKKLYKREQDLNHSIDALRKAGLPEWPFGYDVSHLDRLDDVAIRARVFGKVWNGRDIVNGGPFIQEVKKDGSVAFRSGYALLTGKAWPENDQLCLHFPAQGELHQQCTFVFQNPSGTSASQNEYVLVGETQILEFSTETQ